MKKNIKCVLDAGGIASQFIISKVLFNAIKKG